jgi:hypothetical protein
MEEFNYHEVKCIQQWIRTALAGKNLNSSMHPLNTYSRSLGHGMKTQQSPAVWGLTLTHAEKA